jgi:hypothetical protein
MPHRKNLTEDDELPNDALDTYAMLPKARICEHLDPDTAAAEKAKAVEIFGSAMLRIHLNEDGSTGSRSSPGTPARPPSTPPCSASRSPRPRPS